MLCIKVITNFYFRKYHRKQPTVKTANRLINSYKY